MEQKCYLKFSDFPSGNNFFEIPVSFFSVGRMMVNITLMNSTKDNKKTHHISCAILRNLQSASFLKISGGGLCHTRGDGFQLAVIRVIVKISFSYPIRV